MYRNLALLLLLSRKKLNKLKTLCDLLYCEDWNLKWVVETYVNFFLVVSFIVNIFQVLDQLPKKHELIEFCELTGRQLEVYGGLVAECAEAVKRSENNDGSSFSNSDARSFLMQLRKAANHPLLLRRLYDESKLQKMAHALCKVKAPYISILINYPRTTTVTMYMCSLHDVIINVHSIIICL